MSPVAASGSGAGRKAQPGSQFLLQVNKGTLPSVIPSQWPQQLARAWRRQRGPEGSATKCRAHRCGGYGAWGGGWGKVRRSAPPFKDMAVTDRASLPKLALGEVDADDAVPGFDASGDLASKPAGEDASDAGCVTPCPRSCLAASPRTAQARKICKPCHSLRRASGVLIQTTATAIRERVPDCVDTCTQASNVCAGLPTKLSPSLSKNSALQRGAAREHTSARTTALRLALRRGHALQHSPRAPSRRPGRRRRSRSTCPRALPWGVR